MRKIQEYNRINYNILFVAKICYSITAALWSVLAGIKLFDHSYGTSDRVMAMCLACVWIACAAIQYSRYRKDA